MIGRSCIVTNGGDEQIAHHPKAEDDAILGGKPGHVQDG